MSHTPRRLRPRRQPKGIPAIFRSKTRPVITEQEARVIRARYEDARRRGMPLVVSSDIEIIGRCVMTDEDYPTAANCDDQSGMATDAAWRAVSALRARAERAEAEVQRLHRVIAESLPYIDFAEQFAQAEATIWAVQEACKAKQGPRFHDDPYNRGWDNALAYVESKVALGECDE